MKSPVRLIVFSVLAIFALCGEAVLFKCVLGFGNQATFWVILSQAALVNFMVASVDPTNGGGYLFSAAVAVAALVIFLRAPREPLIKEGIFFGVVCIATTMLTYRARWLYNWRRSNGYWPWVSRRARL